MGRHFLRLRRNFGLPGRSRLDFVLKSRELDFKRKVRRGKKKITGGDGVISRPVVASTEIERPPRRARFRLQRRDVRCPQSQSSPSSPSSSRKFQVIWYFRNVCFFLLRMYPPVQSPRRRMVTFSRGLAVKINQSSQTVAVGFVNESELSRPRPRRKKYGN